MLMAADPFGYDEIWKQNFYQLVVWFVSTKGICTIDNTVLLF